MYITHTETDKESKITFPNWHAITVAFWMDFLIFNPSLYFWSLLCLLDESRAVQGSLSLSFEPEIGHVVCFACCLKFTLSDLCLQSLVSFISCPAPSHLKSHVTYAVNGCLEVLLVFWWLAFHPYITILVCWVLDMKDQVLCQTKHILRGLVPTRKLKTTIKACSMYCKVWQR